MRKYSTAALTIAVIVGSLADAFAATISIQVLQPRGGEAFAPGQTQKVIIDKRYQPIIALVELSTDGGNSFAQIGQINKLDIDKSMRQSLAWVVPTSPSGNCLIRVTGQLSTSKAVLGQTGAFSILASESVSGSGVSHANLTNLDSDDHLQYLNRSGVRSMTGALTLHGNPSENLHAASKQYVDSANSDQDTAIGGKVSATGATMSGPLALGGNKITGLGAATSNGDAVRFEQAVKAGDAAGGDLTGTFPSPSVDLTKIQKRVTGAATAGEYLIGINQDGTVATGTLPNSGSTLLGYDVDDNANSLALISTYKASTSTATFTLSASTDLIVEFGAECTATNGKNIVISVSINGDAPVDADGAILQTGISSHWGSIGRMLVKNFPPGEHTVNVRSRQDSDSAGANSAKHWVKVTKP